ncbi:group 1 truncated hemoglobin [Vibrio lamellibrachiae]|uniref:group I truncated hemoglobin n=1 Tax=Vibrio lamellibrachiae TaxID=2910253 RepID=UPI003D1013F1
MSSSLYLKYGGFGQVHQIVEVFFDQVLASETLSPYFENTNFNALIDHQVNFISSIMGGPQNYDDRELLNAHSRFSISEDAWSEVVSILTEVLTNFGVESHDIKQLLDTITTKKTLILG